MTQSIQNFTFAEFLECSQKPHPDTQICQSINNQASFGGVSLKEARQLAVIGWPEGFQKMRQILSTLEHEIKFPKMVDIIRNDVTGQVPDVAAYLRGEPECMFQIESAPTFERKFARLQIGAAYSSHFTTEQIFWRGAVAIALVHALEHAGFSVELLIDFSSKRGDNQHSTFVAAKAAGQPLDVDRITFLLAHPSSLRRLAFSCFEHLPLPTRRAIGYGANMGNYGSPLTPSHPAFPADIHLSLQTMHAYDLPSAQAEFTALLNTRPQMLEANAKAQEVW